MDLDAIIASSPVVHPDAHGRDHLQLAGEVLRAIDKRVGPGSHTLETGAGVSTALFAARGCVHTCVVPYASEIQRITRWCAEHGVSDERLTFHQRRSEEILPVLEGPPLDLVLIDGGHGFPTPFIDWYYAGLRLRRGGTLIIDDTQIWTGRTLKRYLEADPSWEREESFAMRAAVFRRSADDVDVGEWNDQPFVRRRSWTAGPRGAVRKLAKAMDLVKRRDASLLRRRLRDR